MKKQFLLGLMAMTLPLSSWAAGSVGDFKVDGVTEGQKITYGDAVPTIVVKFTGEDEPMSNTLYDITYTLNGETVDGIKNVGNYVLTVTGKSYAKDATKTTVEFEVTKKTITSAVILEEGAITKTYGTEDEDVELTAEMFKTIPELVNGNTTEEKENFIKCLKLIRKDKENEGNNVGTYSVTVVGDETAKSNYMYTSTSGNYVPMTITAKEVSVTFEALTYNGKEVDLTDAEGGLLAEDAESYSFGDGDILTDDQESVKITKLTAPTNTTVKAANTIGYTLTAELNNENYVLADDGKVTLVINKADVTITAAENQTWKKTYGETVTTDLTEQFTIQTLFEDEDDTDELTMQIDANAKDAKAYDVMPYVNGTAVTLEDGKNSTAMANYNIIYSQTQQFEIEQKDLATANDITISVKNLTYQGRDFSVDDLLEVKEGENDLAEDAYTYTLTKTKGDGEKARNAGDQFTVTIEAVKDAEGNYTGNYKNSKVLTEQEIEKATLTIKPIEEPVLTHVYNGKNDRDVTSQYTSEGLVGEDADKTFVEATEITKMMRASGKDAGTYTVSVYTTKSLGVNDYETALKNYNIEFPSRPTVKYTITPATVTYWIKGETAAYNPNFTPKTVFTYETDGFVEGEDFDNIEGAVAPKVALAEGQEAKTVGEYTLEITNVEGEEKVSAGSNYTVRHEGDTEEQKDGIFEITAQPLTITALTQKVDYLKGEEATLEFTDDQIIVSTKANDVKETHLVWINGLRLGSEKAAIVKALGKLGYKEGVNSQTVGTYEDGLQFTVTAEDIEAVNSNYDVTLVPGKLIVSGATEIVLDALAEEGEEDNVNSQVYAYNGQTLEKVTIKNLKNNFSGQAVNGVYDYVTDQKLLKEKWYTLVLPFDVEVADLSYQFGYAIVNIPNTATKDHSGTNIYYTLTMGTVPANTLMLFKVAKDTDCEKKEFEFKNVTIEAPVEWASDGLGNEYRGVYEKTELTEDYQWFYNSAKDGISRASTVLKGREHSVVAYPLSGYFLIDAQETANVRIFVEDIDGTVTELNTVTCDTVSTGAEGWYSIDGMKLNTQPTQKGIYINNGKKVVIK